MDADDPHASSHAQSIQTGSRVYALAILHFATIRLSYHQTIRPRQAGHRAAPGLMKIWARRASSLLLRPFQIGILYVIQGGRQNASDRRVWQFGTTKTEFPLRPKSPALTISCLFFPGYFDHCLSNPT